MTQTYAGKTEYLTNCFAGKRPLLVALTCLVDGLDDEIEAMVDTGSSWCWLHADLASELGYEFYDDPNMPSVFTALGEMSGHNERRLLTIEAVTGDSLEVEAIWFISEHWRGANVIRWEGCLQRIRFALDPRDNSFLYSPI